MDMKQGIGMVIQIASSNKKLMTKQTCWKRENIKNKKKNVKLITDSLTNIMARRSTRLAKAMLLPIRAQPLINLNLYQHPVVSFSVFSQDKLG